MKRRILLAVLLLSTTGILTGCMSPEQLAETAKRIKARKEELEKNNPEVQVVYLKHNVARGAVLNADDVDERTAHELDDHVPGDALHQKQQALLKKMRSELQGGTILTQHDIAPLVEGSGQ